MAQLPRTQPDATAMAQQMINGFTQHPEMFPSANVPDLQAALDDFKTAATAYQLAMAAAKQAGQRQKRAFAALQDQISNQVKAAQVDTVAAPINLDRIGYGPRRKKTPIPPPAQVDLVSVRPCGTASLELTWKKTNPKAGGKPQNFAIEMRIMGNGQPEPWHLVGTAFGYRTVVTAQPVGVRMEYRVVAANRAGRSLPSNEMPVIL